MTSPEPKKNGGEDDMTYLWRKTQAAVVAVDSTWSTYKNTKAIQWSFQEKGYLFLCFPGRLDWYVEMDVAQPPF